MKSLKIFIIVIVVILIGIQLIPSALPKNNPDLSKDISKTQDVTDDVKIILHKACYDCHSNQTVYPWYSKVAPSSWLVAKDTREGREELNFSDWSDLSKRKKVKYFKEIAELVEEREMPMKIYTVIHRDAALSDEEIKTLTDWTKAQSNLLLSDN